MKFIFFRKENKEPLKVAEKCNRAHPFLSCKMEYLRPLKLQVLVENVEEYCKFLLDNKNGMGIKKQEWKTEQAQPK